MNNHNKCFIGSQPRPVPVPGSPHKGRPCWLHRPYVPLTPASVAVVTAHGWNPFRGRYPSQMNLPGITYGHSGSAGSSPRARNAKKGGPRRGRTSSLEDVDRSPALHPLFAPPGGGSAEGAKGSALDNPARG